MLKDETEINMSLKKEKKPSKLGKPSKPGLISKTCNS
jgi:hypothetical protein